MTTIVGAWGTEPYDFSGFPVGVASSLFFDWVATENGNLTVIATTGVLLFMRLAGLLLVFADSSITLPVIAGDSYGLELSTNQNTVGNFTWTLAASSSPALGSSRARISFQGSIS